MKILIAEDDAVDLQLLQLTLEGMGHEVVVTRTGTGAWEAVGSHRALRSNRPGFARSVLPVTSHRSLHHHHYQYAEYFGA